jgi:hypothetical protein
MYKKADRNQLSIEEFYLPFGGRLSAENRWVKLARLMPWDLVEDIYAEKFKNDTEDGNVPIPARVAFGALKIKAEEAFTDERTLLFITENPYAQYFLGFREFQDKPPFDLSMMVHFRKRFTSEDIARINEELYRRTHPPKNDPPGGGGTPKNKGTLVLDATVGPADIRFPTDLSLLNECRENLEKIIVEMSAKYKRKGRRLAYSRKKARQKYLKVQKQRKARVSAKKKACKEQIAYIEKTLETLDALVVEYGADSLTERQLSRLETIEKVVEQQKFHLKNPRASVPERIVSLRQPFVRPIVRGKAGRPTEFGQKLALSIVDGFAFIDVQRFDSFNEGITLIDSAEKYHARFGCWPEAIQADTIYRNRANRAFCKEHKIRISGPRLGRPKKDEIQADKELAYRDSCERNIVESRNGIAKRRYGLDRILAYLEYTSQTEAAMAVFAMNAAGCLRALLRLLFARMRIILGYS